MCHQCLIHHSDKNPITAFISDAMETMGDNIDSLNETMISKIGKHTTELMVDSSQIDS